jgi:hypothetical protein
MLYILLFSYFISPPGEAAAMESYAGGELCLVYIGELAPEGCRDNDTGILLESLGCEWDEETEEFMEDWNSFIMNAWGYLGSDSTYFTLKVGSESLEYRNRSLVYRDPYGSVPIEIRPEEISSLEWIVNHPLEISEDVNAFLEIYVPLRSDTLRATVSPGLATIDGLLSRGRRQIQINTVSP